jgi:hypothetical protein
MSRDPFLDMLHYEDPAGGYALPDLLPDSEHQQDDAFGGNHLLSDEIPDFLQKMHAASVGPSGEPLDDLSAAAMMRLNDAKETAQQLSSLAGGNYNSINPGSATGRMLGGVATITPGEQPKQVIFWSGEDRETLPVTVTCQPEQPLITPSFSTGLYVFRPFVRLQWGTRNGSFLADVDIGNGLELTLAASSVYVSVGLQPGSSLPPNTPGYTLRSSISFYATTRTSPVTYTVYPTGTGGGFLHLLAPGESYTFLRPQFSTQIIGFQRTNQTSGVNSQYTLDFIGQDDQVFATQVIAAGTYLTAPIVLANDCIAIKVTNDDANSGHVRIIFGMF